MLIIYVFSKNIIEEIISDRWIPQISLLMNHYFQFVLQIHPNEQIIFCDVLFQFLILSGIASQYTYYKKNAYQIKQSSIYNIYLRFSMI